jgi:hypothetical protein
MMTTMSGRRDMSEVAAWCVGGHSLSSDGL